MSLERILIVGAGLVGGSLGAAIKKKLPSCEVHLVDSDPKLALEAVSAGLADKAATFEEAAEADLVFLAVPVSATGDVLRALAPHLGDAIVTDVGSTKASVVASAKELLGEHARFVGGHPMAGSEVSGLAGADPELFTGAWWVLTPTQGTPAEAYRKVLGLVQALGARSLSLEPAEHDLLMATVSHLPQFLASTLMSMAAEKGKDKAALLALAAGGFRDMTRIASSHPELWVAIARENSVAISEALRDFAAHLSVVADHVATGKEEALTELFERARQGRASIPLKADVTGLIELQLEIADRPGLLAEVTTTLGSHGVNIEDIAIHHATEGGHGTLSIWVRDDVDVSRLIALLKERDLDISTST